MSDGGYIKLWRKIEKNGWFQNPRLLSFWIWCISNAAYKQRTQIVGKQRVELQRGQFAFTVAEACIKNSANPRWIRTSLDCLKKWENIAIKTTNKFSVITIINYDTYQSDDCFADKQTDKQKTNERQTKDKPLIKKEGEEGKEGEEEIIAASPTTPQNHLGILKTKYKKKIPDDFEPTQEMISHATGKGLGNVYEIFDSFKAYHIAKGDTSLSWGHSWQTWCGNELRFGKGRGGNGSNRKPPHIEKLQSTMEIFARRQHDRDQEERDAGQDAGESGGLL